MGQCAMVSLWFESLLTNTRFRVLYFRMNNCEAHLMLHQEKEVPNDSRRPLCYSNFTDKKQNIIAAAKKPYFLSSLLFLGFTYHYSMSSVLQMTINFALV